MRWHFCEIVWMNLNTLLINLICLIFRKLVDSDFEDVQLVKTAMKRIQVT